MIIMRMPLMGRVRVLRSAACVTMTMALSATAAGAFSTGTMTTTAVVPNHLPLLRPSGTTNFRDASSRRVEPVSFLPRRSFATIRDEDCGCDVPPPQLDDSFEIETRSIGTILRETVLTNTDGNPVKLGNYVSDSENDAIIIVFLRHLA